MTTHAILLAAGLSTRFGTGSKLLHPYHGRPLLHHALSTLLLSKVDKLSVITGGLHEQIESNLRTHFRGERIDYMHNPNFSQGLASSIKIGLSQLGEDESCLVCLGDMPNIKTDTINQLISEAGIENDADAFVPIYQGIAGNPVLFKPTCYSALQALTGDKGAKAWLSTNEDRVKHIAVADSGIHKDMDRQADFKD